MNLTLPFGRSRQPVCYEVRLAIAPERADELDEWLPGHVREMLAFPGFQDARVYRVPEHDDAGRELRVVSYDVRSRRELDSYLRTHARRMRDEGVQRFGKDMAASRDIVPQQEYRPAEGLQLLLDEYDISGGLPICGNCHNPVEGRFCKICGQEDRTYLLSLKELVGEFFGELTNFDSRFFRSMKPLLFKPGFLTLEYTRGRRQSFFPPIRLYIIISLLFFFFAALMTDDGITNADFGVLTMDGERSSEDREAAIREIEGHLEDATGAERQALEGALAALRAGETRPETADAGIEATAPEPGNDDIPATPREAEPAEPEENETAAAETGPDRSDADVITGFELKLPSVRIDNGVASASGWGSEELNTRMAKGAEAIRDNPRAFVRSVMDNIPSMMLIFLPLIALALKVLYLFSRRYYVEHLMFSLHIHSAVFVILLFWMLVGELAESFTPLERVMGWITAAVWIYIPVYLYKSLRCVYGQGHFMTSMKFFLLFICYTVAAGVTSVFLFVASVYQQA